MKDNLYLRILNALSLKLCLYFTLPGVKVNNRYHYCKQSAVQPVTWLNIHPG